MLYNSQYGGFGFSQEFLQYFGITGGPYSNEGCDFAENPFNRTNPLVFKIIDLIGLERASGDSCKLAFEEIHEDDIYLIDEYDGKEKLKYIGRAKHNLIY
jgi:hypothetical protein